MTKAPDNITQFNLIALELFNKLYNKFPTPIDLTASKVGLGASPQNASYDESWNYMAEAEHVVTWLTEEGFLRYKSHDQSGSFFGVRLTLRGLTVLGYIPTSLNESEKREPIIDKIKGVLKIGAEKAGTEAVKSILSELFKLALASGGLS
jgi:hypothetical protein